MAGSFPITFPWDFGAPFLDVPGELQRNGDHCSEGQGRLIQEYKNLPRMEELICIFLREVQEAENVFWRLYTQRVLDTAEGVHLDGLGDIVGEGRKGRDDTEYRKFIRVRILVNRSGGKTEELYQILLVALGATADLYITEHSPSSLFVRVLSDIGTTDVAELRRIMEQAKAGGVNLTFGAARSADTFEFGASIGELDSDTGWGSTTDTALGGDWGTAV